MCLDISFLARTAIFRNMTEADIQEALHCLRAQEKQYRKDEIISAAGNHIGQMGMVLSGSATIESNDYWGNRTILQRIEQGQYFLEAYAWMPKSVSPVDVRANETCRVLLFSVSHLRAECTCFSGGAHKVLVNLLTISSSKNMTLTVRNLQTSPKTIRERVILYLNTLRIQNQSNEFDIPFDRQQLADYLNLERTALSKELSKMQADGLITYHKNHFILHRIRDESILENGFL